MNRTDIISALDMVINCFEQIGIDYYIGGSVASSAFGISRATLDVDLIAKIKKNHVDILVKSLKEFYYIEAEMINNAIQQNSSFNLIHLETMIKIDVFIFKGQPYDLEVFGRRQSDTLDEENPRKFYLSSPEDIILSKLQWYRRSNEVLQQQWKDVLGIMKVQANKLDLNYLILWAANLNISDLLNRLFYEVGLTNSK